MGVVESVESAPVDHQPKADKVKKPRASRAKPKLPADPDAPVTEKKVRAPRKKADKKADETVTGIDKSQSEVDQGNIKLPEPPLLVRESVELSAIGIGPARSADEVKKRGRPAIDRFATVSARIRGGEFADSSGSKAKLAIYVSRVLAEDKAFRPQMKELLTELGHIDLLSVFALR